MKKNKLYNLIFILSITLGLLVMIYPKVSMMASEKKNKSIIETYDSIRVEDAETKLKLAEEYNRSITDTKIEDAFTHVSSLSDQYYRLLNIDGNGLMGYITIPKIDVSVPIYHGTSTEILNKGAGHFEGSSLPIGGASTHSVISAHRGLPSNKLFADLDQLEEGDKFYIHIMNNIYAYQVDQVKVVEPSEIEDLNIVEGEDYVTLVTCTPYGINTHRLLVRGTRVEYKEENISKKNYISSGDLLLYIGLFIYFIVVITTLIITKKKKG